MTTPPPENAQAPPSSGAKRKLHQSCSAETSPENGFTQGEVRICQLLCIACQSLWRIEAQLKRLADSRESERQFSFGGTIVKLEPNEVRKTLRMCWRKRAFASRAAARAAWMHVYQCPVCRYFHRSSQVSRIQNPVLPSSFAFSHDDERERRRP